MQTTISNYACKMLILLLEFADDSMVTRLDSMLSKFTASDLLASQGRGRTINILRVFLLPILLFIWIMPDKIVIPVFKNIYSKTSSSVG